MKLPVLLSMALTISACSTETHFSGSGLAPTKASTVKIANEDVKPSTTVTSQQAAGESTVKQLSAKNGENPASQVAPTRLFNVAILTQSVQCLFCHMKIEGDVGGIQFPPNSKMHERAGEGLRILGTLYGTNEVPSILAKLPQAANTRANYNNSELKIFPTTKDATGKIEFPAVNRSLLVGKTKGFIKAGNQVINNTHSGPVTIVSSGSPIEVDGEIFIDGDLVIGGNYRGLGTIYARNIFIVKDLKAGTSPFPFPANPETAKQTAVTSIAAKHDGLYLFALGQITVGYPDPKLLANKAWFHANHASNAESVAQPPIDIQSYKALAEAKTCNDSRTAKSSTYLAVLVNRVDAFLYSSDYLLWRTCNGFELNGGFVAPSVALVNAGDTFDPQRTKEPRNTIRYDYRLRAGVKAYTLLKDFFE